MPADIKKLLEESLAAIALLKSIRTDVPKEAEELVEVFERCLRSEAERDRLREAIWPGLPKFVPTDERPKEDFYIIAAESLHEKNRTDSVAAAGRTWADIAASAYAAYGASTGNKNFRGDPMPRWDQLSDAIRTAWEAAVRHAADVSDYGSSDDPGRWAGWVSPSHADHQISQ